MKDFILDSTYKDAIIVNSNGDIFVTASNNLPYNPIAHHSIYLNKANSNNIANYNKKDRFNAYSLIDNL